MRPPNILLIVADDLGFDDLPAEARDDDSTSNLDRLAAESTRFDRFYTAGAVCSPTRASLLTGRYPQRFGFRYPPRGLPSEITTLPELLHDRGYVTHHVGKWHIGSQPASVRPNAQGFDTFFGFLHARSLTPNGPGYHDPRLVRDEGSPKPYEGHLTEILTEETIRLIESASTERPWLINLWYFAPHEPIEPPGQPGGATQGDGVTAYRELIGAMDAGIGRILEALRATGQSDRTVVVFISDNGSPETRHNRPLLGGKTQFFEGGTRVPFLMRVPGEATPPRVDQVVSSLDLYPTLAALAGAELRETVDGVDLSPLLRGDDGSIPGRTLFWENRRYVLSSLREVRPSPVIGATSPIDHGTDYGAIDETGRWRYAYEVGTESLLDLEADATGSTN
ncbi:MAG: sulfatase-like hydrolase/transferase, partial [Deltaproteobacteria bacterium]|nr:sulfatase-like hydrolase/transferase [Deltaproteobacteria bacterium]